MESIIELRKKQVFWLPPTEEPVGEIFRQTRLRLLILHSRRAQTF